MLKKMLAPNSGKLHKSSTVILSVIAVLFALVELINQNLMLIAPVLAPGVYPWIAFGLAVATGAGRYFQQRCLREEKTEETTDGISDTTV
jgi:hypothetical protein